MQAVWEFFENLDEYVYVADMDTYELIYMNKRARIEFGILSMERLVGKKCHEVLQDCSIPCAICTNPELKPGSFKRWIYYNPVLNKHALLFDTMVEDNGKRYRIEIAIDVSDHEVKGRSVRLYEKQETIANAAMDVALSQPTPDKMLQCLLEYIGHVLEGSKTFICEINEEGNGNITYEWVAASEKQSCGLSKVVPAEICHHLRRRCRTNRHIIIRNIEELGADDAHLYEFLKRREIYSLIIIPLYDVAETIGFYGVDNLAVGALDYASGLLHMFGRFIESILKQRDLLCSLKEMSLLDQLTRLGNRYAMYQYIEETRFRNDAIGVVFCDVTGLKRTNDTLGHQAGDSLILAATSSLQSVFGGHGLFRIGGDELLAICRGISQDEITEKAGQLKKVSSENGAVLAVGASWTSGGVESFDTLISAAEKKMYEDKSLYYRAAGIDRRR